MRLRLPIPDMDLAGMARRLAGEPRRRAILTKRANVDSESPGRPQMRPFSELEEHLESDPLNAVMLESGDGWVAVYTDVSTGDFAVSKVPLSDESGLLGKKIGTARDALDAAMQVA